MLRTVTTTEPGQTVTVMIDGEAAAVPAGVSVAAALMLLGRIPFRHSPVDASPRMAYCMMGVCFECLVTIDGKANTPACQQLVTDGMCIERQTTT